MMGLDKPPALRHRRASNASALPTQGHARVAQLVEHVTENHGVGGSIPSPGTIGPSSRGNRTPRYLAEDEICILLQIESIAGLDNIEAIAAAGKAAR